jgi:hypothetical protein
MPKGMESGPQNEFKQNVEDAGGRNFRRIVRMASLIALLKNNDMLQG